MKDRIKTVGTAALVGLGFAATLLLATVVEAQDKAAPLRGEWTLKRGSADAEGRIADPAVTLTVRFLDGYKVVQGRAEKVTVVRRGGHVLVVGPDGTGRAYERVSEDRLVSRRTTGDRVLVRGDGGGKADSSATRDTGAFPLAGRWHPEPADGSGTVNRGDCEDSRIVFGEDGSITIRYGGRVRSTGECEASDGSMTCRFESARGKLVADVTERGRDTVDVEPEGDERPLTLLACPSGR